MKYGVYIKPYTFIKSITGRVTIYKDGRVGEFLGFVGYRPYDAEVLEFEYCADRARKKFSEFEQENHNRND